jgi:iron-sulfur cluster assembly protein
MNASAASQSPGAEGAPGISPAQASATPTAGAKKASIEITANAAVEIARQRDKRGNPTARIRVGVRGGGCTGFSYVFEWADEPRATDREFHSTDGGVAILVDPKSLVYLAGMQLDFVRGMMGHGFKFNNPNAKGACGCGESVQF